MLILAPDRSKSIQRHGGNDYVVCGPFQFDQLDIFIFLSPQTMAKMIIIHNRKTKIPARIVLA